MESHADRRRQAPTGVASRRRRLSDQETAERMVGAAVAMVNRSGLTVSLDHLSFEDVIRDAGVSRSAVYRRWPYKDLFFSDLLRELARATTPAAVANDKTTAKAIRQAILDRISWLGTAEHRHDLVVELLRQGALRDFDTIYQSTEWRTYLALHATFLSLEDGELRDDVRDALRAAESGFVASIAATYERMVQLLGYRIRDGATFDQIATLASATMRGMVIMALSTPDVVRRQLRPSPFGGTEEAEWSLPAIGIANAVLTFLEPDPAVVWDAYRIDLVRDTVQSWR
jgi:AcrR family transcriptional regulator